MKKIEPMKITMITIAIAMSPLVPNPLSSSAESDDRSIARALGTRAYRTYRTSASPTTPVADTAATEIIQCPGTGRSSDVSSEVMLSVRQLGASHVPVEGGWAPTG
jgi:hypothetical protein